MFTRGKKSIVVGVGVGCPGFIRIRASKHRWIEVLAFVSKIFHALRDAVVAEAPFGCHTAQAWAVVVLFVVGVPNVAVFDRELVMPLAVRGGR